MSNNINWGKIYESTAWGSGVTDNNISWGKSYADLAGGGGTPFVGLLDTYSGAAAAYSLRQLSSTYSGNAIKVRRASDNAEQDIAFSNNELDTATLETFASGTDAFVTTWYDQSGNGRNATQATAAAQPKIVSSGSTILDGGKATLEFDNSNLNFAGTLLNTSSAHTNFALYRLRNGNANNNMIMTLKNNSKDLLYFMGGDGLSSYKDFVIGAAQGWIGYRYNGIAINEFKLLTDYYNGSGTNNVSNFSRYSNNTLQTSISQQPFVGSDTTNNNIGNWGSVIPTPINITEIIIYPSDESSNISAIQTNINDFYSIY